MRKVLGASVAMIALSAMPVMAQGAYPGLGFGTPVDTGQQAAPANVQPQTVQQPVQQPQPGQPPMPDMAYAQARAPTSPSQAQPQSSYGPPAPGPTVGGTLWGSGTPSANGRLMAGGDGDGYCDPEIEVQLEKARAQEIDARVSLARNEFSLSPSGILNLSCVDRILNSTINIFNPGNLQSLLSQFTNSFSCTRVLQAVNGYANQQISQYTGMAVGAATGALAKALPIGNVIPGVSLGSLTGSINLSPQVNIGGVGGAPGSGYVNLGQVWNRAGNYGDTGSGSPWSGSGGNAQLPSRLLGQ